MKELEMHNGKVRDADAKNWYPWCPECECYTVTKQNVCAKCETPVIFKQKKKEHV
jgi:hypothetical protein